MDQLYVVATFSISILLMTIFWYFKFLRGHVPPLPPGPRGLPILGYLPFLDGNNLINQFTELGHKYGPIFRFYLGNRLCVVISSPSLVKEVLRDQDAVFAYLDTSVASFIISYGGNDIGLSQPNSQWRAMRKLFVQEMMSSKCLEASYLLRRDEIRKAITQVHNNIGNPIEIGLMTFRVELNVIMNMIWGGTIEGEEAERIEAEFYVVLKKLTDLLAKPNISDVYPILAGLDIQGVRKQAETYMQTVDEIFEAVIAKHKTRLSGEMICKQGKVDFLQTLLQLESKQDSEMSITVKQLKGVLLDVVSGGTDTTATTIEWAMAEVMNHPAVMSKAQEELREVVGLDNIVEEHHVRKLKYLEAIIKEAWRLHPPVPFLFPRSVSATSTVGGYTIPKNTKVFVNMCSIQRDPSIWDDPMEFKPERFLDDNGKCDHRGNHFHYLPFGSGKRICPGIPLAEKMGLYFLASLLHSFDWKTEQGKTVDMSETFGIAFRKTTPLVGIPSPRLSDPTLYV